MEVADTLGFLLGTWQLERTVDDHAAGATAEVRGTVTILPARDLGPGRNDGPGPGRDDGPGPGHDAGPGRGVGSPDAEYEETGEMQVRGRTASIRRRLGLHRLDGSAVMLHFGNGLPFVDLDLRRGDWRSVHLCRADRYDIETLARSPLVVEERWRVRGPEKDYDAVTTLTRLR